jgi:adenylate cyclase
MTSLPERLRERKLVQWTLAYLASAWLLLQVLDVLAQNFAWPPVLFRAAAVILAVGLVAALVLAWYHGEKGRQRVSGPELLMLASLFLVAGVGLAWIGRDAGSTVLTVLMLSSVFLLVGAGLAWFGREVVPTASTRGAMGDIAVPAPPRSAVADRQSIAVLPFANLSENKDNEYFSDGITDEILTTLANVRDLRVISRISVMRYKETEKSLREIAAELGVAHVLEGSIQRAGERVRINAQLIDAQTDAHLWAERYDRPLEDIFSVQSEIAQRIAHALQAQLSASERARVTRRPTTNLAAHDYLLRARGFGRRQTPSDNAAALSLLHVARELDPSYPDALAVLSDCLGMQYWYTGDPIWLDAAVVAARHAITLDAHFAPGHASLGWALNWRGEREGALEAHRRAMQLNSDTTGGLANVYHFDFGRLDEAARWWAPALKSDPTNSGLYWLAGRTYLELELPARAAALFEKGLEFTPGDLWTHFLLSTTFLLQGRPDDAQAQIQKLLAATGESPDALLFAGYLLAAMGDLSTARRYLERGLPEASAFDDFQGAMALAWILRQSGDAERAREIVADTRRRLQKRWTGRTMRPEDHVDLSRVMVLEGDVDGALQQMEQGVHRGWRFHHDRVDFILNSLRGEPRYERLMAEVKADVDRMRARVEREGW